LRHESDVHRAFADPDGAGGLQGGKLGDAGGAANGLSVEARQIDRLIGPGRGGQSHAEEQQ
jgi:hypothetical protein